MPPAAQMVVAFFVLSDMVNGKRQSPLRLTTFGLAARATTLSCGLFGQGARRGLDREPVLSCFIDPCMQDWPLPAGPFVVEIPSAKPGVPRRTIGTHRHVSAISRPMNMGVFADNCPARYHVNHRCIGCRICSAISPQNFRSNHECGLDYVYKQPNGPEEERLCAEAMDICPVDAIDRQV